MGLARVFYKHSAKHWHSGAGVKTKGTSFCEQKEAKKLF
jgi:hypothetical protein